VERGKRHCFRPKKIKNGAFLPGAMSMHRRSKFTDAGTEAPDTDGGYRKGHRRSAVPRALVTTKAVQKDIRIFL